jgi:hypothetical protein
MKISLLVFFSAHRPTQLKGRRVVYFYYYYKTTTAFYRITKLPLLVILFDHWHSYKTFPNFNGLEILTQYIKIYQEAYHIISSQSNGQAKIYA